MELKNPDDDVSAIPPWRAKENPGKAKASVIVKPLNLMNAGYICKRAAPGQMPSPVGLVKAKTKQKTTSAVAKLRGIPKQPLMKPPPHLILSKFKAAVAAKAAVPEEAPVPANPGTCGAAVRLFPFCLPVPPAVVVKPPLVRPHIPRVVPPRDFSDVRPISLPTAGPPDFSARVVPPRDFSAVRIPMVVAPPPPILVASPVPVAPPVPVASPPEKKQRIASTGDDADAQVSDAVKPTKAEVEPAASSESKPRIWHRTAWATDSEGRRYRSGSYGVPMPMLDDNQSSRIRGSVGELLKDRMQQEESPSVDDASHEHVSTHDDDHASSTADVGDDAQVGDAKVSLHPTAQSDDDDFDDAALQEQFLKHFGDDAF